MRRRLARAARGGFKLVYVAPERLAYAGLPRAAARSSRCPLVAIDEAHCISEWGHDFRPDYLAIGALLAELRRRARARLHRDGDAGRARRDPGAARARRPTRRSSCAASPGRTSRSRAREVQRRARARARGRRAARRGARPLRAPAGAPPSSTRRRAARPEAEAARLAAAGWRAAAYHAGLERRAARRACSAPSPRASSRSWSRPTPSAWASTAPTCAPSSTSRRPARSRPTTRRSGAPAATGRAARACCCSRPATSPARRRAARERDALLRPSSSRHKWSLFLELMRWAEGGSCRHDAILRYFGDEEETLAGCGRCDVCRRLDDERGRARRGAHQPDRAQGALGGGAHPRALRPGSRGPAAAGASDPRLERAGLERTPTFGALARARAEWTEQLLRRCVTAGWVDLSSGERPLALLTDEGQAVMRGEREARLLLPSLAPRSRRSRRRRRAASRGERRRAPQGREASEKRAERRRSRARPRREAALRGAPRLPARARPRRGRASLRDPARPLAARHRPAASGRACDALRLCFGVGPAKAERWGEALLAVVRGS